MSTFFACSRWPATNHEQRTTHHELRYSIDVNGADDPILGGFYQNGAYLHGHFRLTSGLHSPEYLQCALVLQYPKHAERFGQLLAAEFRRLDPTLNVGVVAAPAI